MTGGPASALGLPNFPFPVVGGGKELAATWRTEQSRGRGPRAWETQAGALSAFTAGGPEDGSWKSTGSGAGCAAAARPATPPVSSEPPAWR